MSDCRNFIEIDTASLITCLCETARRYLSRRTKKRSTKVKKGKNKSTDAFYVYGYEFETSDSSVNFRWGGGYVHVAVIVYTILFCVPKSSYSRHNQFSVPHHSGIMKIVQ